MQVVKVLNNSLLLAIDDLGQECILMGKGIGYKKAIGTPITKEEIEKIFLLKDKRMLVNFAQLASELDETYFTLAKEIIDHAQIEYQLEVMDYLYLSLTDHLSFAIQRLGTQNSASFNYEDVVRRYRTEYKIGQYAVQLVNEKLAIKLPNDEASAIGLHFVNAKLNSPKAKKEQEMEKLVKNIERIAIQTANIQVEKVSFSYARFLTHLNYFVKRVFEQKTFKDQQEEPVYDSLKNAMNLEYTVIKNIERFIYQKYELSLSKQEKIYLFIHLHRLLSENNE